MGAEFQLGRLEKVLESSGVGWMVVAQQCAYS